MLNRFKLSIDPGMNMNDGNGSNDNGIDELDKMLESYLSEEPADSYDPDKAGKEKSEAIKQVRSDNAKRVAEMINKQYKQQKTFTSEALKQRDSEIAALKAELEREKGEREKVKSVVNQINDDRLVNHLRAEEEKLFNDSGIFNEYTEEIFGDDYKKKIKDRYIHASAAEQRYISPKEALAIEYFDKVVAELNKYKQEDERRTAIYGGTRKSERVERPDVVSLDDALKASRTVANKFGL